MSEKKNALVRLFNYDLNQESPVQKDYVRKVSVDEDGNEFITFEEVDYPAVQQSLGSVLDWSLDALLKAGVNPNFPIHTGFGTRLEGYSQLGVFQRVADEILAPKDSDSADSDV